MNIRTGQIVRVDFSDHTAGKPPAYRFTVYGRLASVRRKSICVVGWGYTNAREKVDVNCDKWTIVRSAIHRIALMGEREVLFDERENGHA